MASASDAELEYLTPSFEPSSLTVPKLRAILVSHDISYPASAKKPQLIDIFTQELVPRSRRILAARSRTQRSSRGITDMPSSKEGTVDGDEDTNRNSMPPPPVPESSRRKSRKIVRDVSEGISTEPPSNRKSASKRASGKHARPSDTETEPEPENKRPLVRKTRRSHITTPTIKFEEHEVSPARSSLDESAFSHDNPFQSGSSPPAPSDSRRASGGVSRERRRSSARKRKTEGTVPERPRIKQEEGIVVPSAETFETPVRRRPKPQVKDEPNDGVEIGEEFTPEEQLELVRERAANGEQDIVPPRRKKARKLSSIPKSAPWVVLLSLLSGYALWWRREKLEVGYCGIGRPSISFENYQVPEWVSSLQPQCEPCPQHAICYGGMKTKCEEDFILQPHPLSLAGLVPLSPTCEPDGEKVRRVRIVADKAIEELRERKASWECGTLLDGQGKHVAAVELDVKSLKEKVGRKRKRGMTDAEFEDLWKGALGEIKGREEVVHSVDERNSHLLLASTSLNRLPLGCALRRSIRLALARYRIQLAGLVTLLFLSFYIRYRIMAWRATRARVPGLVATTLDRLATQAALHARGDAAEEWISVGQLRDDVLREEFDLKRREDIWKLVKAVVEMNANIRASVREGRGGEVSRVWEWIGSVGILGDEAWSNHQKAGRRATFDHRVSFGGENSLRPITNVNDPAGVKSSAEAPPKWDEGRPIY